MIGFDNHGPAHQVQRPGSGPSSLPMKCIAQT